MNLTRFTDYSLRILMYAATLPGAELANIDEVAQVYGISGNHLMKSVHRLGKLGLLVTTRGRNGGFRLAKQPSEINIGWVIRQTEENWNVVECFDEQNGFCILNPNCRLKGVVGRALKAYFDVLDSYTLADIVENRDELQMLFHHPNDSTQKRAP